MSSVEKCHYDFNSGTMVTNGAAAPAPAPAAQGGWELHEPPYLHSMKYCMDGIEHMTVIRANDIDSLWKQVKTVTQMIKAARAKAAEAKAAAQEAGEAPAAEEPPALERCPLHGEILRVHRKGDQTWRSHRLADGTWCRGGK